MICIVNVIRVSSYDYDNIPLFLQLVMTTLSDDSDIENSEETTSKNSKIREPRTPKQSK